VKVRRQLPARWAGSRQERDGGADIPLCRFSMAHPARWEGMRPATTWRHGAYRL